MNEWSKWLVAAILSLLAAFMTVQWQQAESEIAEVNNQLFHLEVEHGDDIARLDESMKTRRNQIADLEERIAVVEERTK